MPYPGLLHPEPLQHVTADLYICRRHWNTQRQVWLSLCGVCWCTQVLCEPSEHLWWVWGLILNVSLPLLPSCWGFSFALGHGVTFFGEIQYSPVDGCSSVSCSFGVLTGEDERTSFYSASLMLVRPNWKHTWKPNLWSPIKPNWKFNRNGNQAPITQKCVHLVC